MFSRAGLALLFCGWAATSHAALQFDVFLGYDGIVPEAAWFPVVCEIKNDGPSFMGLVEISAGNLSQGQTRRLAVELPTGTLKRVVLPVFSTSRGFGSWNARLLDERGKLRSEQPDIRPRRQIAAQTPLLGSLPRTAGGAPQIEPILPRNSELQPGSARLLPAIFPDNPLVLEGMKCFYLNSEKAADLSVNQVSALQAWLQAGGHLIVAVEQPGDLNGSPWLKDLFPCEVREVRPVTNHTELGLWVKSPGWASGNALGGSMRSGAPGRGRSGVSPENPFSDLPEDAAFAAQPVQVASGRVRDGKVEIACDGVPMMVSGQRGRGRITALLFSPEREPVRSWKLLPIFWARLIEVPGEWYVYSDFNQHGGFGSDSIFGAMLDSRQINKLPIGWLLVLLIVYLVVIGPLDHYWLKRIGRPMLTWITFPCYVVAFSLVIYFIGYKLRAGESEWNELHVVDVMPERGLPKFRGRTFASVYSPANQRYVLESQQKYATVRGEFLASWGGRQNDDRTTVMQSGDSFKAEIFVPVWTSQLIVSDWWHEGPAPVELSVKEQGGGWVVKAQNLTGRTLANAQVVIADRILPLGKISPGQTLNLTLSREQGMLVRDFAFQQGQGFQNAVQSRQNAFVQAQRGRIDDWPNAVIAASFISHLAQQQHGYMNSFIAPPGLDVSDTLRSGTALFMAWDADHSPTRPLRQFTPKRNQKNTFWRVTVPVS